MAEQVRWEEERKVMVADKQKTRKEKADEAFTEMMNQLDSEQGDTDFIMLFSPPSYRTSPQD